MIWNLGMSFSIIASTAAGPALAYGLGQGATLVGALWGVLVWKEFKECAARNRQIVGGNVFLLRVGTGNTDCVKNLVAGISREYE